MTSESKNVKVSLSFEKTDLPPFKDILILGNKCPLGMNGVGQCLDLLVPDGFGRYEVEDEHVAAVLINRNITKRVSAEKILAILRNKVFPYVGGDEIIKVDFTVHISYDSVSIDLDT